MDDPYRARCIAWLRAICFGEPRRPMPPLPARMPPPPDIRFDYLRRRAGLGPAGGVMGAAGSKAFVRFDRVLPQCAVNAGRVQLVDKQVMRHCGHRSPHPGPAINGRQHVAHHRVHRNVGRALGVELLFQLLQSGFRVHFHLLCAQFGQNDK